MGSQLMSPSRLVPCGHCPKGPHPSVPAALGHCGTGRARQKVFPEEVHLWSPRTLVTGGEQEEGRSREGDQHVLRISGKEENVALRES